MILEEERILSEPGRTYSVSIPKQWVEEYLRINQSGKAEGRYKVLFRVNNEVITITPIGWRYKIPSGQLRTSAHSAFEAIAQHLKDDPERTLAIIQKEEPAP